MKLRRMTGELIQAQRARLRGLSADHKERQML
jgi:hypothetical protein